MTEVRDAVGGTEHALASEQGVVDQQPVRRADSVQARHAGG